MAGKIQFKIFFTPHKLKKIFSLLIFFQGFIPFLFAQKAADAPGVYRRTGLSFSSIPTNEKTTAVQLLDAIAEIVKKIYPQPLGTEIGPYGGNFTNYRGVSEFKNGPYVFHMTIAFFELYKTNSGAVQASGEYASDIKVWINDVRYILQGNPIKYGNDRVFRNPLPGNAVNGFPKYNNMILLLPPGKSLPWRPATKQEYLENFIEGLKASLPGRSSVPAEKQLIVDVQKMLASMSPAEKKQIAYLQKWKYDNKDGVSELSNTIWNNKWAGFLEANDTTAGQLVIVDENFYNKTLPRSSFQVIVIARRYPPASLSAAAPTPERISNVKRISERLNAIVRHKDFLSNLQQLLGKDGILFASQFKKGESKLQAVVKKPVIKNIDRLIDSLMKNYKVQLPQVPSGSSPVIEKPLPEQPLPPRHPKKLALSARKLNTTAEVKKYLDELDNIFSTALAGTTVPSINDANTAIKASYGYWIFQRPRESLLLAIKTAKQEPENNTAVNNLAATLSLCGVEYLAIPLYIVCLKKEPANSTLTNNLGQSYLSLGDHQQAEFYLKKAIRASPHHHHANNSLGLLYQNQGNKDMAIQCFENSLRGSFTLDGFNGLKSLKKESALKLMSYIRHRYKQPDYINFDKYPPPLQCISYDQTEIRKGEHKYYQKTIDDQIRKYDKLKAQQKPIAAKANEEYFRGERKNTISPFLPFAQALIVSIRKEYEDKFFKLQKDLVVLERNRIRLKIEFDTTIKQIEESFAPRLDALGEGNADPTLDEEICEAMNSAINSYLPQFAEINEERYRKIIHAHKDYLNDYLYWVRFSSFTEEQYRLEYYEVVLSMLHLLREVKLTTLNGYCNADPEEKTKNNSLTLSDPDCPLPIGVEIPFVVGKIQFDCKSWGLEIGEAIVFDIEHLMGGATTIAIGPGVSFYSTPKIGGDAPMDINPGIDIGIKGQVFVTFDATTIIDWGLLFESEIDFKGVGKPLELKQNVTLAVNKGLTAEGPLTYIIDKVFEIPPETQINKNIKIYNPQ